MAADRGHAQDPHSIGFHVSALYSPLGWLSWEQVARDWEAAQGDEQALKTFRNTVLGETWQEQGEAPDWERLLERREAGWRLGTVPRGAVVLTAGADLQRDRIEVSVWGWAAGLESWLVEHAVLPGSPGEPAAWDRLAAFKARDWPRRAAAAAGACGSRPWRWTPGASSRPTPTGRSGGCATRG